MGSDLSRSSPEICSSAKAWIQDEVDARWPHATARRTSSSRTGSSVKRLTVRRAASWSTTLLPSTTWSAHWLARPEFRDAVADYLRHERDDVARYAEVLAQHSPFRQTP